MITVGHLLKHLESIAPLVYQESYDNSGLLVGNENQPVSGVLICLDVTREVLEEAMVHHCNVIVSHHPIIFRALKSITGRHFVERIVMEAIRQGINLVAMHTNLDNVLRQGVNTRIADRLALTERSILAPTIHGQDIGAGLIGILPQPLKAMDFLHLVKEKLLAQVIRHTTPADQPINFVAVCGGSGSFLLSKAVAAGAQALVTADFKYHDFFEADARLMVVDTGHYESEQFTIDLIKEILQTEFSDLRILPTKVNTNPVRYLF